MHICAIVGAPPTGHDPGRGSFFIQLLEEFSRAGHSVSLIVPLKMGMGRRRVLLPPALRTRFVPYLAAGRLLPVIGRRISVWSLASSASAAVAGMDHRPDVLLGHFLVPAGIAVLASAKRTGIPAFCSLGESDCRSWFTLYNPARVAALLRGFRRLYPVATHIETFVRNECGLQGDRVITIPNAVDGRMFFPMDKRASKAALGVHDGRKIALFVGSAQPRKGTSLLAKAADYLPPEWEVWLVGPGHDAMQTSRVRALGSVQKARLPMYYSAADVFVLPSSAEGMPNALLEAIACEARVVVSRLPSTIEVLGECYPLFCDLEPADIAAKIVQAEAGPPCRLTKPISVENRASRILSDMALALKGG